MIDVGAGDGHASVRLARARPDVVAIALDPSVDRLRDGARIALRQRIANALFVVAAIEDVSAELASRADEITVNFPWGSLLRGLVRAESRVLCGLAALAKAGACVRALLSIEDRDASSGLTADDLVALSRRTYDLAAAGLALEYLDVATPGEIGASGSSWAKRLGARRAVYTLRLRRLDDRTRERD